MTKKCSTCHTEKELSYFHKSYKRNEDGYQHSCKECSKIASAKHYQKNKDKIKNRTKNRARNISKIINLIKESYGCFNCLNKDYRVLEFHHLLSESKSYNVADMIKTKNQSKLILEINKCVVVCANCHRLIHHKCVCPSPTNLCNITETYINQLLLSNK